MYGTFIACVASYYFGFYTWMFINIKPNSLIEDKKNKFSIKKYKQL
jgi:hypothetical protein